MSLFKKKKEENKMPACACNGDVPGMEAESMNTGCCCNGSEGKNNDNCCCNGSEEKNNNCCSNGETEKSDNVIESIKVLGSGCKSCHELFENTQKALENMGYDVKVEYVTDMQIVISYGVMSTPAMVINEKVVSMGKVLKPVDVEKLVHKLGF